MKPILLMGYFHGVPKGLDFLLGVCGVIFIYWCYRTFYKEKSTYKKDLGKILKN
jgi:hypothetical protein